MSGIENTARVPRGVDGSVTSQTENTLKATIDKRLLRHAVGHAIFCPSCGEILDYRRAVLATGPAVSATLCVKCWDRTVERLKGRGMTAEQIASKIDVIDGRTFGRRSR